MLAFELCSEGLGVGPNPRHVRRGLDNEDPG